MRKLKPRCLKIKELEDFTGDEPIFIDANIFLYNSLKTPEFVKSYENFLNEVWFKLIVTGVVREYKVDPRKVARFIKRNPKVLETLDRQRDIINEIEELPNLEIVDIPKDILSLAKYYSKDYLLLTNDALHLAVMKQNNIINLASNDSDFERVDWINLYKPRKE